MQDLDRIAQGPLKLYTAPSVERTSLDMNKVVVVLRPLISQGNPWQRGYDDDEMMLVDISSRLVSDTDVYEL